MIKKTQIPIFFIDTITAFGLGQYVDFVTHNKDNILDLVMAEPLGKIKVTSCIPGPFFSDHCAVNFTISVTKQNMEMKEITFPCIKDIDYELFAKDLHLDNIEESELDSMVESFNKRLQTTLDSHTPEIRKIITTRPKNPWFTPELKLQKQAVRCREKAWRKYKEQHHWPALQTECNTYKLLLKSIKRKKLTERVGECRHDTKDLYVLVANLTDTKSENPLPSNHSDEDMANMFTDYFMEKIRSSLDDHPKYEPSNDNITPMLSLTPMTEDEVLSTINVLKTKTCETDPIPTNLFKKIVPLIIDIVTKLINISLTEGAFSKHWKTAIICPLLKKPGTELIASNYRLVSNLPFLSKVVEKIVLTRFNKHCDKYQLMPGYQSTYRN